MAQASPYSFNSTKNGPIVPTIISPAAAPSTDGDKKDRPSRKRRSASPEDDKNSQPQASQSSSEPPKKKKDVEAKDPPALKVEVDEHCLGQGIYFENRWFQVRALNAGQDARCILMRTELFTMLH